MKDSKAKALNLRDENVSGFIEMAGRLSVAQGKALFGLKPKPITNYDPSRLNEAQRHEWKLKQEKEARKPNEQELFEKLNSAIKQANPDAKTPLLNEELKLLILEALTIAYEKSNDEEEKNKKILLIKAISPGFVYQKSEEPSPAIASIQQAIVEEHQAEAKKAGPATVSAQMNPNDKMPAVQGTYDFLKTIDENKTKIIDPAKSHGYIEIEKATNTKGEETRRLVSDDGNYIDISKNGSMKSNAVDLEKSAEEIAKELGNQFIAMMDVYNEVALVKGKDGAFQAGAFNMSMATNDTNGSPEEKEKLEKINKFAKEHVEKALAKPPLAWLKDKFLYDGEKIGTEPAKTNANLPLKPQNLQSQRGQDTHKTMRFRR